MSCQHTVTDYDYFTWHRCRACGLLVQRGEGAIERKTSGDVAVPFSFLEHASRPHAGGHPPRREELMPLL